MSKNTEPTTSKIEKNVMDRIKKGQVKMRPRLYYLIVGFLSVLTVLLLSVITSYFMSVVTLWLRVQAAQGPAYGVRDNLSNLLGDFPWWAAVIGALSLALIVLVTKKIGSLYKTRLAYLIPSIVILFLTIGFLLSYSSLPGMFNGRHQNTGRSDEKSGYRLSNIRYRR